MQHTPVRPVEANQCQDLTDNACDRHGSPSQGDHVIFMPRCLTDAWKELPEEVFDLPHVSEMRARTEKFYMLGAGVMFPLPCGATQARMHSEFPFRVQPAAEFDCSHLSPVGHLRSLSSPIPFLSPSLALALWFRV